MQHFLLPIHPPFRCHKAWPHCWWEGGWAQGREMLVNASGRLLSFSVEGQGSRVLLRSSWHVHLSILMPQLHTWQLQFHTCQLPGVPWKHSVLVVCDCGIQYHLWSSHRGLWGSGGCLHGCHGSVAEHWWLKPVSWVWLPATNNFFIFLYFCLITFIFSMRQDALSIHDKRSVRGTL